MSAPAQATYDRLAPDYDRRWAYYTEATLRATLDGLELRRGGRLLDLAAEAFAQPWAFEFIRLAYVWHFTSVTTHRSLVMQETWRRVAGFYPGAIVDDGPAPAA